MHRVISVFLPTWPTDRLRRLPAGTAPPRDAALVLKGTEGRRRVVTAMDDLARSLGICLGMPVAKAQALVDDLLLLDADPVADRAALDDLALWGLRRYSPIVMADPPDGLVLDVTGATHRFGGEAGILADIIAHLADKGIKAEAALSETWAASHALARYQPETLTLIAPGKTNEALLSLPVEALRLPASTLDGLRVLGFDTIGELASQPRAPLTLRFGPELFRRIDMAFGRMSQPVAPIEPPEMILSRRAFFEPIGAADTMAKYTRRLVADLCDRLEDAGEGALQVDLRFYRVDNRVEAIQVRTAKPVRDEKRLGRLLCDRIETVDPGFGIERMVLAATLTGPLCPDQIHATFGNAQTPDVDDLWDTLTNRYGRNSRLYRSVASPSDIPERAVQKLPVHAKATGSSRNATFRRPFRLLRPPEAMQTMALLPDHPPVSFQWRGSRYRVTAADGPERVRGEWWRTDRETGKVRDYFILEVESGERFWAFRTGDGQNEDTGALRWYMHGKFA
ncbi:DNA polymerase Y family protein [Asticcacaulis sp. SL142]|uniref:Y-family DNA polymerase n=1 Tax=Asticcacaulis sp. SL142 TaxID=2995155 RepID=UPI00226CE53F|nr:DNA polymerase Y family protein [Asticcacaulis sp. SL142]WAC49762.1 DNA polymerase Y family protein [Asticcacaulis sp. SL142]